MTIIISLKQILHKLKHFIYTWYRFTYFDKQHFFVSSQWLFLY